MAEDVTSDILMYFIFKGTDPIEAESSTVIEPKSDAMTNDFKPGKFFEVSDFTFGIKLKDKETHEDESKADLGSYARWRSMDPSKVKPDPVYKADIDDFSISRAIDASSPLLMQYCMTRSPFVKAVLVKRARGPSGVVLGFMRMEFTQVLMKSISWSDGDAVRETCKFRYDTIAVSYIRRQMDGSAAPTLQVKWDGKANG